jgi:hypothetical protein
MLCESVRDFPFFGQSCINADNIVILNFHLYLQLLNNSSITIFYNTFIFNYFNITVLHYFNLKFYMCCELYLIVVTGSHEGQF